MTLCPLAPGETPLMLAFYASGSPLAVLERLGCQPPFAPLADVPSHVGLITVEPAAMWEMTWPVGRTDSVAAALALPSLLRLIPVAAQAARMPAALDALRSIVGMRYSVRPIAGDVLARLDPDLPARHPQWFAARAGGWDCSVTVGEALLAAGVADAPSATAGGAPLDPERLMEWAAARECDAPAPMLAALGLIRRASDGRVWPLARLRE